AGAEQLTVDNDSSYCRGCCDGGGRADAADDASAAETRGCELDGCVGVVELVGEATMEIVDELTAGERRARLGVVELDRGAHRLDVVGSGLERLGPAVAS